MEFILCQMASFPGPTWHPKLRTSDQLRNVGGAQEDSDCILHTSWQAIFEKKAAELLDKLQ